MVSSPPSLARSLLGFYFPYVGAVPVFADAVEFFLAVAAVADSAAQQATTLADLVPSLRLVMVKFIVLIPTFPKFRLVGRSIVELVATLRPPIVIVNTFI